MDLESLLKDPNPFQITQENNSVSVSKDNYISSKGGDKCLRTQWVKTFLQEVKESTPSCVEHDKISKKPNELHNIIDSVESYISKLNLEQKEKIPHRELIAQKRQLLLLNMSLNLKRQEIQKLDEKLKTKKEALEKSAQVLEEDALRFDSFLKDNDKKAQTAIRMAEKETKKKVEKLQEVKVINQELQAIQSNINKHTRNLDEYVKYGAFLDSLVPEDWIDMQNAIKVHRRGERRRKRIELRKKVWLQDQSAEKEGHRPKSKDGKRQGEKTLRHKKVQDVDATSQLDERKMPDFEDEPLTSDSEEETPMYFTSPQELLDKFAALEEDNLFLIQNVQEAQQSLEEMTARLDQSMDEATKKMNKMKSYINDIKSDINDRQNEIDVIHSSLGRVGEKSGMEDQLEIVGCQDAMTFLVEKVKDIYLSCGYTIVGTNPSLLFMLSQIESVIDKTLERMKGIPKERLNAAVKLKEKARREKKRLQQQEEQKKLQEERNRKVLERSLQPPKKQVGKKLMYRSYLTQHVDNHGSPIDITDEEILEKKFFTLET